MCHPSHPSQSLSTGAVQCESRDGWYLLTRGEPPYIPPGSTVEINLIGNGPARAYAMMINHPFYSDPENSLIGTEIMTRCLDDLRDAISERRSAADIELWQGIVRRLCWVETLVDDSTMPCSHPLMEMVERGREHLLAALIGEPNHDRPPWSTALETLEKALQWCQELARESDAAIRQSRERAARITWEPFGSLPLDINYPGPMLRGLFKAAQLGIETSTLEVGHVLGGDAVVALRGRKTG